MKTKDFFTLALKLFALYSLITMIFNVIPSYMTVLIHDRFGQPDYSGAIYAVGAVALLTGLFVYLVNRSAWVVEKLRLDRGFEESTIPLDKLDANAIVKIACIIIGGMIFVQNIPYFLMHLYAAFRMDVDNAGDGGILGALDYYLGSSHRDHVVDLAINTLNLMVSWLLLTNYDFVARKLVAKQESDGVN